MLSLQLKSEDSRSHSQWLCLGLRPDSRFFLCIWNGKSVLLSIAPLLHYRLHYETISCIPLAFQRAQLTFLYCSLWSSFPSCKHLWSCFYFLSFWILGIHLFSAAFLHLSSKLSNLKTNSRHEISHIRYFYARLFIEKLKAISEFVLFNNTNICKWNDAEGRLYSCAVV